MLLPTVYTFSFEHFKHDPCNPRVTTVRIDTEGDKNEWQLSTSENLYRFKPDRWAQSAGEAHTYNKAVQELIQGAQDTAVNGEGARAIVTGHMGDGLSTGINVLLQKGVTPTITTKSASKSSTPRVWINLGTDELHINNISEPVFKTSHILNGESGKRTASQKNIVDVATSINIIESIPIEELDSYNMETDDEPSDTLHHTKVTIPFADKDAISYSYYNLLTHVFQDRMIGKWDRAMVDKANDGYTIRACSFMDNSLAEDVTKFVVYVNGLYVSQEHIILSSDRSFNVLAVDIHTAISLMEGVDRILSLSNLFGYTENITCDNEFIDELLMDATFLRLTGKMSGNSPSGAFFFGMFRDYRDIIKARARTDLFVYSSESFSMHEKSSQPEWLKNLLDDNSIGTEQVIATVFDKSSLLNFPTTSDPLLTTASIDLLKIALGDRFCHNAFEVRQCDNMGGKELMWRLRATGRDRDIIWQNNDGTITLWRFNAYTVYVAGDATSDMLNNGLMRLGFFNTNDLLRVLKTQVSSEMLTKIDGKAKAASSKKAQEPVKPLEKVVIASEGSRQLVNGQMHGCHHGRKTTPVTYKVTIENKSVALTPSVNIGELDHVAKPIWDVASDLPKLDLTLKEPADFTTLYQMVPRTATRLQPILQSMQTPYEKLLAVLKEVGSRAYSKQCMTEDMDDAGKGVNCKLTSALLAILCKYAIGIDSTMCSNGEHAWVVIDSIAVETTTHWTWDSIARAKPSRKRSRNGNSLEDAIDVDDD